MEDPELWTRVRRKQFQGVSDWLYHHGRGGRHVNMEEEGGITLKCTPLDLAIATSASVAIVKLLLLYGADPNTKDRKGNSPLNRMSGRLNIETVRMLLDTGANANNKSDDGKTPLYNLASLSFPCGSIGIAEMLLEHGVDVDTKNIEGYTPLMAAVSTGSMDLVLWYSADIYIQNDYGLTAEDIANHMGHSRQMIADTLKQEDRKQKSQAFAMAEHERLGEASQAKKMHRDAFQKDL